MGTGHMIYFEIEECCNCGMQFGLTTDYQKRRRRDGESFYCPSGHPQSYTESEIDKLKKQVRQKNEALERERGWRRQAEEDHEHTQRRLTSTKGVVTRIKNRVSKGVCPCCKRSFSNLHRHMESKHPGYTEQEEIA